MTARNQRLLHRIRVSVLTAFMGVMVALTVGSGAIAQPFASLIMDVRSGEILEASNSNTRLHPASLTKMMTLYIAFEAVENGEIDLDTRVRISRHAASQPPSRLGLRAGQTIAFRYLIRAAALRSANDAAAAIAEALEGSVSAFSQRMNRTARAMGMNRTNFHNPHGLTAEGHMTTAQDMARLARQLYYDFPQYYNIFSRLSDSAGIATVRNTNRRFLGSYRGADGIKTGFTNAAGYNLAAMAERDGVRILVIVMGARSSNHRHEQVVRLMNRGFSMAPARVAVRRPPRPDYVRGVDDSGSGVSAGRVIRLQTAPDRSLFPRHRPLPGEAPPEALIAELRDDIDEVIADIREPNAPETEVEAVASDTTQEPEDSDEPETAVAEAPEATPFPRERPEVDGETVVTRADATLAVEGGALAALGDNLPVPVETAAAPSQSIPTLQFDHSAEALAGVYIEDGLIIIPGLPPISTSMSARPEGETVEIAALDPMTDVSPLVEDEPGMDAPAALLVPERAALSVDEEGRVLWQDEELLSTMAGRGAAPVSEPSAIILTSAAETEEPVAAPMPEIVTRAATTGGREWAVELGLYPSQFDAERVLLRLALSESSTLGTGVRSVVRRSGRFAAEVNNLSEDQAQTACLRLVARNHPCSVITP